MNNIEMIANTPTVKIPGITAENAFETAGGTWSGNLITHPFLLIAQKSWAENNATRIPVNIAVELNDPQLIFPQAGVSVINSAPIRASLTAAASTWSFAAIAFKVSGTLSAFSVIPVIVEVPPATVNESGTIAKYEARATTAPASGSTSCDLQNAYAIVINK